jgi:hypothetical protein
LPLNNITEWFALPEQCHDILGLDIQGLKYEHEPTETQVFELASWLDKVLSIRQRKIMSVYKVTNSVNRGSNFSSCLWLAKCATLVKGIFGASGE